MQGAQMCPLGRTWVSVGHWATLAPGSCHPGLMKVTWEACENRGRLGAGWACPQWKQQGRQHPGESQAPAAGSPGRVECSPAPGRAHPRPADSASPASTGSSVVQQARLRSLRCQMSSLGWAGAWERSRTQGSSRGLSRGCGPSPASSLALLFICRTRCLGAQGIGRPCLWPRVLYNAGKPSSCDYFKKNSNSLILFL